jgi:hypothetical protein
VTEQTWVNSGLLPEECFVEKLYGGQSSNAISYHSFTNDLDDSDASVKKGYNGTRIKRLRRGYSKEADQLLDWLVAPPIMLDPEYH